MDLLVAHEQSLLEVGKWYSVAHARIEMCWHTKKTFDIPVIPFLHRDAQFGADFNHYHVDGRFSNPLPLRFSIDENGMTNCAVIVDFPKQDFRNGYREYIVLEIVYKRRKCKRLTTGVKPPINQGSWSQTPNAPSLYAKWYNSMVGKNCKGRKCPHLQTTMIELSGELICPLHNLRGDIKKEIILPLKTVA